MKLSSQMKGLKELQTTFDALARPDVLKEIAERTQDEIRNSKSRPSLSFINHVLRGFLRDAMRAARR